MSAPRLAGEVVGSIPTRSTKIFAHALRLHPAERAPARHPVSPVTVCYSPEIHKEPATYQGDYFPC